ncbi:hypothetical protein [Pseudomonas sp. LS_2]|uniref:hypothetical protein n=1 Tax=Pseudomonas sp. LS_2 TaxID=3055789 RepID=UPI003668BBFC
MASNAATLVYNFLGNVPTNRVAANAQRISTFGAVLSLASAAAQYAGVSSAVFGANVGTAISLTATATRAIYAAFGPESNPLRQIRDNWRVMIGFEGAAPSVSHDIPLQALISAPRGPDNPAAVPERGAVSIDMVHIRQGDDVRFDVNRHLVNRFTRQRMVRRNSWPG